MTTPQLTLKKFNAEEDRDELVKEDAEEAVRREDERVRGALVVDDNATAGNQLVVMTRLIQQLSHLHLKTDNKACNHTAITVLLTVLARDPSASLPRPADHWPR